MSETYEYFQRVFVKVENEPSFFDPACEKTLTPIAHYRSMGWSLVLYKTDGENEYCAHSFEGDFYGPPSFGFGAAASYNEALQWCAKRYDYIRKNGKPKYIRM